jgi:crotonobetainyl-CoA:carnitine CoA-transferase CaiB-like acyl-CoA transferase
MSDTSPANGAPMSDAPLSGLRVADLGWVVAGPITGHILADLGAEVIKVESVTRLDSARVGRPIPQAGEDFDLAAGDSGGAAERIPLFHTLNRGKLGLSLNLTMERGREVLKDLVRSSDVLIENFAPGVMERLGLSYETLSAVNERLVMASLSAYGQQGPSRTFPAYGPAITALGGFDSLIGYSPEEITGVIGIAFSDCSVPFHAVSGILAALLEREETGLGQHVDLSQVEAMVGTLLNPLMQYAASGVEPEAPGNSDTRMCPHGIYHTADDRWLALAARDDRDWQRICDLLGGVDEALRGARRFDDRAAVDALVSGWAAATIADDAAEQLAAVGVPASPVMGIGDQIAVGHFHERGDFASVTHPVTGEELVYGLPLKLDSALGQQLRPAPLLGQHTHFVLSEILGYSANQIAELHQEGALT